MKSVEEKMRGRFSSLCSSFSHVRVRACVYACMFVCLFAVKTTHVNIGKGNEHLSSTRERVEAVEAACIIKHEFATHMQEGCVHI